MARTRITRTVCFVSGGFAATIRKEHGKRSVFHGKRAFFHVVLGAVAAVAAVASHHVPPHAAGAHPPHAACVPLRPALDAPPRTIFSFFKGGAATSHRFADGLAATSSSTLRTP